jgi:hypothetical protein
MSTSSRRTYPRQLPALLGHGKTESFLAGLFAERVRLSRLVPADLSHQFDHVRRQSHAVERDIADLYDGTGRWAHTSAGISA